MKTVEYTTRKGVKQFRPVLNATTERLILEGNVGCCLGCGAEADGVEPDARKYKCESCGAEKVYGLEELLIMGLLR